MRPSCTQKITRAIFPPVRLLHTSQRSRPNERTNGMPIGQENSTSLMSSPMILPVRGLEALQPLTNRFPTAIRAVEVGGQPFKFLSHG